MTDSVEMDLVAKLFAARRWFYPQESVKSHPDAIRDAAWDLLVDWHTNGCPLDE